MANNEFMALFGSQSVAVSVLSETDSVKYKLVVRGSNADSRINEIEVSLNDTDIIDRTTQRGRGLNLAVINADTMALVEWKYFDIYTASASNISAFMDYVNNLPINRIVAIYSYDGMKSSTDLDNFIKGNMGSLAWPGVGFLNRDSTTKVIPQRSSYSAIYSGKMRKIVCENFVGNSIGSLNEDTRSFTEIVFDTMEDVGANGIPQRIIDDISERVGDGSSYEVYTWPNIQTVGSDVYSGDILRVTADLFQDQDLTDAGGYAAISITAYDDTNKIIDEKRIDSRGAVGKYISKEDHFVVPVGSTTIKTVFYHFPSSVRTGVAKAKNVVLTKASRTAKTVGTAAIGVNGIRLATAAEKKEDGSDNPIDRLLSLPVATKGTDSNKVMIGNFAEMETFISDSNTYESGSSSGTYQFKSWAANDVMLSSLNLKPGDRITISAEMSRDATAIANRKYGYILIRFAAGSTYISDDGINGDTSIPDVFDFRKKDIIIPPGATMMRAYAVRGPSNITATGNIKVRNVKYRIKRGA